MSSCNGTSSRSADTLRAADAVVVVPKAYKEGERMKLGVSALKKRGWSSAMCSALSW